MKFFFFLITMLSLNACIWAQSFSLTQYKATNGIMYKIGDTLRLNVGSQPNGKFKFVLKAGFSTFNTKNALDMFVDNSYKGRVFIIKEMELLKQKGKRQTLFLLVKGFTRLSVYIDSAILYKEITSYYDTAFFKPKAADTSRKALIEKASRVLF